MKEAMVPVNKGVVSYSQTFMLAQAFHKAFPFWSFPLYPKPTRMQTPSYGKRFKDRKTLLLLLFQFVLKGKAGQALTLTVVSGEHHCRWNK